MNPCIRLLMIAAQPSTRDAILDASDRIMSRWGFRKMTMDDLAREAGVSRRTIYVYFKGKEDVGLSSIGRVVEKVHDELERLLKRNLEPDERLRQMLTRRVMGRIEQIAGYYQSLDELFEVVRPAYMARRRRMFEREIEMIAAALDSEAFQVADRRAAAEAMLLATNAFLPYSLSVRELGDTQTISRRLDTMVTILLRGLRKNGGK